MKTLMQAAALLAALAATGAAIVVVLGVVPIKASSGHWWITAKFLDFAKWRSVATHSFGITAPPLADEGLVVMGASHYETGCYPCHGKPGAGIPPVMAAMTPPPPELTTRLSRYRSEELFSIVKHGIKLTGMPAWPAQQRDDEVWAMVAFLRRMPDLDVAGYERLAHGAARPGSEAAPALASSGDEPPSAVRTICWRCHGADGTGRRPGAFPALAGQRSGYMHASLRAFADRTRFSGVMSGIAAALSESSIREIATYYERLPLRIKDASEDAAAIARGGAIATRGIPHRDIPACRECHGPTDTPKNPTYPKLAGQYAQYLELQLKLLQQRRRGGSANVNLMYAFVDRIAPEEIRDVARYYASLDPSAGIARSGAVVPESTR